MRLLGSLYMIFLLAENGNRIKLVNDTAFRWKIEVFQASLFAQLQFL
jgi:hypothetical protein